uniref:Uncharacterized protein n=1 Tax=Arundo donax TaxID=35708 RepID=A0A0A8YSH5_ARUDO
MEIAGRRCKRHLYFFWEQEYILASKKNGMFGDRSTSYLAQKKIITTS